MCWPRTPTSSLQAPRNAPGIRSNSVQVSLLQCPLQGGEKLQLLLALSHLNQHPFAHRASKFQLAEKRVECLRGTLGETELALPPQARAPGGWEMGWMKLTAPSHLLSSPSFQMLSAIVMVLPPIWDLQLLCPCCICRCHLQ